MFLIYLVDTSNCGTVGRGRLLESEPVATTTLLSAGQMKVMLDENKRFGYTNKIHT